MDNTGHPGLGCFKKGFRTRSKAKAALKDCLRRSRTNDRRKEKRIYKCPHCGFYHLTKNEVSY